MIAEFAYVDGALLLAGWDLWAAPVDRTTNVLYALAVDESPSALTNKADVRLALDRSLLAPLTGEASAASTLAAWGTSHEAQQGQDAMMRLLGG